jgi:hypothetical protein
MIKPTENLHYRVWVNQVEVDTKSKQLKLEEAPKEKPKEGDDAPKKQSETGEPGTGLPNQ